MYDDLRQLIDDVEKGGQLVRVNGAHWDVEIGTINEINVETRGKALLFDEIVDYPKGYRVCTNLLQIPLGMRLAFGIEEGKSDLEVIRDFKNRMAGYQPVKPRVVKDGPVLENVKTGDDVDMFAFPAPRWHEADGGRYIGTGTSVITRDPDTGWVNYGTYRSMIHTQNVISNYSSPGKHGTIHRNKYWKRGEACPVAMSFGSEGMLFGLSTMALPSGASELEVAGFLRGEPVDVIEGPVTGLPIPATAEIVVEGFAPVEQTMLEGPFGEWTGYYASGANQNPIMEVKAVYFRNDPIIYGQPPTKPVTSCWFPVPLHTAPTLWAGLEAAGISGIKGIYIHGPGERTFAVVSIEQQKPGHAMQVGSAAAALLTGGAMTGKFVVVVDEDVDPSDLKEVLWAISTRCDIETAMHVIPGFLDSGLDPSIPPHKRAAKDITMAKCIINACRPWHWKAQFPPLVKASVASKTSVMTKWPEAFTHLNREQYLSSQSDVVR
ncbi:MAG: UbiD family decarboxylase [Gaiellales bacterium]|nr:UbiD family decarboxylase [Gaiellales bacterium]